MTTLILIVVSVGLLVWGVMLFRSRNPMPWPAIGVCALTCGVAFTVGGASGADLPGPNSATVGAAAAGVLCVASAILALVPRSSPRASRLPIAVATVGIVVGGLGLLFSQLTG